MDRTPTLFAIVSAMVCTSSACSRQQPSSTCAALADLTLPNTAITAAEEVAAGSFAPPPGAFIFPLPPGAPSPFSGLPPFCRITGKITPVPDSEIGRQGHIGTRARRAAARA